MKRVSIISITVFVIMWSTVAVAQPLEATQPTEVIGRLCKTMDEHPADPVYNVLDFATCGPGGLRVYPKPSVASEFHKIKFGVQGKKPGKEVVYLYGYMRTKVMAAFGAPGTPSWRPRFRFSWLEVDRIKRGVSFVGKPRVKRKGDVVNISVGLTNPLNKPIVGTQAVINLKGTEYLEPFTKMVPTLNPGEKQTIMFDILASGRVKGSLLIKNYGRIYIDIIEKL